MASIILEKNKIGYHPTSNTAKIGDGVSTWDELVPFNKTAVEDVLTSTSIENALSAKQGKVLKDRIDTIETAIGLEVDGSGNATVAINPSDLRDKVAILESDVNDLKTNSSTVSTVSSLTTRVANVEGKVSTLESNNTTNQNNIASIQSDITALQAKDTSHDTSISSLNTKMSSAESRISTLETELNKFKTAYPMVLSFVAQD